MDFFYFWSRVNVNYRVNFSEKFCRCRFEKYYRFKSLYIYVYVYLSDTTRRHHDSAHAAYQIVIKFCSLSLWAMTRSSSKMSEPVNFKISVKIFKKLKEIQFSVSISNNFSGKVITYFMKSILVLKINFNFFRLFFLFYKNTKIFFLTKSKSWFYSQINFCQKIINIYQLGNEVPYAQNFSFPQILRWISKI